MEQSTQLNVRLTPQIVHEIEEIAQQENRTRTDVVRQLLLESINRWKLKHALTLYRDGQVTKARAAEIAEVSLYDMHDIIRQQGIPLHYDADEAREDMTLILERAGIDPKEILE